MTVRLFIKYYLYVSVKYLVSITSAKAYFGARNTMTIPKLAISVTKIKFCL